ncbi:MAG: efflux RND transporter permease subunit, partial [FCB group bacterium]|nr:efflux RND transporter permease subunit [FCB group bacterium]
EGEKILLPRRGPLNIDKELAGGGGEVRMEADRAGGGLGGGPRAVIARTIRRGLPGKTATKFRMGDEDRDVTVRLPLNKAPEWETFDKIYLPSVTGEMIPLNEIARPVITGSASTISHKNKKRNFTVRSDVAEGFFTADITADLKYKLDNIEWPEGYDYIIEGETKERDESFASLRNAAVVAALVIYAILVLQFNSFIQPLVIFSALPMAFIGAILGLYVTKNNFGFMAFLGLESLIGIVINDAIVLLDFVNRGLKQGMSKDDALVRAGTIRFIPILLTSITTIGGLLPLTLLSGRLWAPLGWTMVGGLIFSTVLTLIIVPVLFKLMVKGK